jgi:hypothetical protein
MRDFHPRTWHISAQPRAAKPQAISLIPRIWVNLDFISFCKSALPGQAALDRNIELGILIRDRAMALAVGGYFRNLIDRDLLKPLPLA